MPTIFLAVVFLVGGAVSGFATHQEIAGPDEISRGPLGARRYLSNSELREINPDVDLNNVKYLFELDLSLLASGGPRLATGDPVGRFAPVYPSRRSHLAQR
ncbi:MAG: hypothetical protein ACE5JP_14080 [Candidatus Bipolaricaulia bacterium]